MSVAGNPARFSIRSFPSRPSTVIALTVAASMRAVVELSLTEIVSPFRETTIESSPFVPLIRRRPLASMDANEASNLRFSNRSSDCTRFWLPTNTPLNKPVAVQHRSLIVTQLAPSHCTKSGNLPQGGAPAASRIGVVSSAGDGMSHASASHLSGHHCIPSWPFRCSTAFGSEAHARRELVESNPWRLRRFAGHAELPGGSSRGSSRLSFDLLPHNLAEGGGAASVFG